MDQGSPACTGVLGLPKASRRASARVVVGFHWATTLSGPGMELTGTKVLATKVMGNRAANAMPVTPSGVATRLPSSTPTHTMAKEKAIINT